MYNRGGGRSRNSGRSYYVPRGRGRSSPSTSNSSATPPLSPFGSDGSSLDTPLALGQRDKVSHFGSQTSGQRWQRSNGSISKQEPVPADNNISSDIQNPKLVQNSPGSVAHNSKQLDGMSKSSSNFKKDFARSHPTEKRPNVRKIQVWQISSKGSESHSSVNVASKSVIDTAHLKEDETSPPVLNAVTEMPSKKETELSQPSNEKTGSPVVSENYDGPSVKEGPFDIARLKDDETSLPVLNAVTEMPSTKETELSQTSNEKTGSLGISKNYDGPSVKGGPFDICQEHTGSLVKLKAPLLVKNREKRKEISRAVEGLKISILRSGMIVLKNYISLADQVKIVKTCRELGLGKGGFYQPGYRDGAELHLKMMCLGKNWDPETSSYVELRPFDHASPPAIPNEFHQLVKGAIQDSHKYLQKQNTERNVEYILPSMSPNLCIVNFYTNTGHLGLHQDKDESQLSIGRKLPVVSFSIGDSAEFLYGDQRDVEKAEKVILESGDVLIFGGKSRLIFHGVKTILRDTAPMALRKELNLRPGRLNLTFREY